MSTTLPLINISLPTFGLLLLLSTAALYIIRQLLLPKPIPGIPYNKASASRLLGDLPDVLAFQQETGEVFRYFDIWCKTTKEPIFQVFFKPFKLPWVFVSDVNVTIDALKNRTPRDFERSDFFRDILEAFMPNNQVVMATDANWRKNRGLMSDTMSNAFLRKTCAPMIHAVWSELVELWKVKARIAQRNPFEASKDIEETMLDTIVSCAFGFSVAATQGNIEAVKNCNFQVSSTSKTTSPVEFPRGEYVEVYKALRTLGESSIIGYTSPLGRAHHKFAVKVYPSLRKAMAVKRKLVEEKIQEACVKASSSTKQTSVDDEEFTSATDLIVKREIATARRQNRAPEVLSESVQDELTGFVFAGHETTATTLDWAMKLLTANPRVQSKLRTILKESFPNAAAEKRNPSVSEIADGDLPYLDAVIQEILRMSGTTVATVRKATKDTELMGKLIPKGCDVFFMTNGPGYLAQALQDNRTQAEKDANVKTTAYAGSEWNSDGLGKFMPERWLREDGSYDLNAGPMHLFGLGLRACPGKKLATLMIRMSLALLMWNFDIAGPGSHLENNKAKDGITHAPQQVLLTLQEI